MKKTLSIALIAATGIAGLATVHAQEAASASGSALPQSTTSRLFPSPRDVARHAFAGKDRFPIEFKIEKIDNGVILTKTSTDAEVVKKLQAENAAESPEAKRPGLKDLQVSSENVDGGVKLTITSTDADTVKKLQERPEHPFPGHHGPKDMKLQDVQVTVEKTDTGVIMKRTSTDAETVKRLQEMEAKMQEGAKDAKHPRPEWMANVQVTVTNLDNGVQTELSSSDAATIEKLQNQPARPMMKRVKLMDKAPEQE